MKQIQVSKLCMFALSLGLLSSFAVQASDSVNPKIEATANELGLTKNEDGSYTAASLEQIARNAKQHGFEKHSRIENGKTIISYEKGSIKVERTVGGAEVTYTLFEAQNVSSVQKTSTPPAATTTEIKEPAQQKQSGMPLSGEEAAPLPTSKDESSGSSSQSENDIEELETPDQPQAGIQENHNASTGQEEQHGKGSEGESSNGGFEFATEVEIQEPFPFDPQEEANEQFTFETEEVGEGSSCQSENDIEKQETSEQNTEETNPPTEQEEEYEQGNVSEANSFDGEVKVMNFGGTDETSSSEDEVEEAQTKNGSATTNERHEDEEEIIDTIIIDEEEEISSEDKTINSEDKTINKAWTWKSVAALVVGVPAGCTIVYYGLVELMNYINKDTLEPLTKDEQKQIVRAIMTAAAEDLHNVKEGRGKVAAVNGLSLVGLDKSDDASEGQAIKRVMKLRQAIVEFVQAHDRVITNQADINELEAKFADLETVGNALLAE